MKAKNGLTLVELLLTMGLILLFVTLTLPFGVNFYKRSTVRDLTKELESSLREAQSAAIANRGESDAGIKINPGEPGEPGEYVIFEGSSYENRRPALDIPQSYPGEAEITVATGASEVVFQKETGLPISPDFSEENLVISIDFQGQKSEIIINHQGLISTSEK